MGVCVVMVPTVIAAWPIISATVAGAVGALGFTAVATRKKKAQVQQVRTASVSVEVANSSVLTEGMRPDDELVFTREDVTVRFFRDQRGACGVEVRGANRSETELKKLGETLAQKVVQQYVYHKLKTELKQKDFAIVEEEVGTDNAIRIQVRRWVP